MISFDFYSESESFNWIAHAAVVGFVGKYNPKVKADFTVIGQANETSGQKRYSHTATLDTGSNGEVRVAIGISVRWETEMIYNVDDIKVTTSQKA